MVEACTSPKPSRQKSHATLRRNTSIHLCHAPKRHKDITSNPHCSILVRLLRLSTVPGDAGSHRLEAEDSLEKDATVARCGAAECPTRQRL
jgi:hypothetical protein